MFPVPFNDAQRIKSLKSYGIIDTPPEESFDSLTRLACRQFGTSVALVSLVDQARQWFKSHHGLDAQETPRELAFCGHAILSDDPLAVLDATRDARFASNALVCSHPGIRFYAGAPLITPQGFRLGTFCIIDFEPREDFPPEEIAALQDFALTAMQLMELRKRVGLMEPGDPEGKLAEDAKADVYSTIAHEIRSPVAALSSCAKIVEDQVYGPLDDERYLEFFSVMSETADQVVNITDRMLEFAGLKTGEVELVEAPIQVSELLEKVTHNILLTRDDEHLTIRNVSNSSIGIVLKADATYVTQMLNNLICNSIKYSDGSPTIELRAGIDTSGALEISVSDSGIGMDDDGVAKALEPYGQVKQQGRKSVGGVGIGIPLVKRLIELHGGELSIESHEGEGTKVTLNFPSYRVEAPNSQKNIAI